MNARAIFAVVRKDLKVASQNKGVTLPMVITIVALFVILPWLVTLLPSVVNAFGVSANDLDDVQELLHGMAPGLQQELARYENNQIFTAFFLVYMLAPLFLIIPLMVSSVIAADSFAGEKERKTMEALLYTPTTDRELFVAKLLSGWLAALAVALAGFVLYVAMANAAAWSQMYRIFFPNAISAVAVC
jgi:ABC-2 type transport system permease protein